MASAARSTTACAPGQTFKAWARPCSSFCTAAHALGYGACWMTAPVLAAPAIEKLLGAEPRAHLAAIVPVGRPAGAASPTSRLPLADVLEFR